MSAEADTDTLLRVAALAAYDTPHKEIARVVRVDLAMAAGRAATRGDAP